MRRAAFQRSRREFLLTGVAVLGLGLLAGCGAPPGGAWPRGYRHCLYAPDRLLVRFRAGADPAEIAARHGATLDPSSDHLGQLRIYLLLIPHGTVRWKVIEFSADPWVEFAEPAYLRWFPEDPPEPSNDPACGAS